MTELDPTIFTPEALYHANQKASEAAAKAAESQAEYEYLDKFSDDVLSEIMSKFDQVGDRKTSESKLERISRTNSRWQEHIRGLKEARLRYYQDRAEAKNAEREWQTLQSCLSYLKESIKREIA